MMEYSSVTRNEEYKHYFDHVMISPGLAWHRILLLFGTFTYGAQSIQNRHTYELYL